MELGLIISAISGAIGAGVSTALTETSKAAISDSYQGVKNLIIKKCGEKSEVIQAVQSLEAKPDSEGRKATLREEFQEKHLDQDSEIQEAISHLLALLQPQQEVPSTFIIHNHAPVQGQTIGNHNTITQQFGEKPHA